MRHPHTPISIRTPLLVGLLMSLVGCGPQPSQDSSDDVNTSSAAQPDANHTHIDLSTLSLPEGFSIEVLSDAVPNARQMVLSAGGTLYVGTMERGDVYALPNALAPNPPPPVVIASDLVMPSGLAMKGNDLYVGALHRVLVLKGADAALESADPAGTGALPFEVLLDDLPDEPHHGWKYLGFSPEGALYIPVGAPCNICLSDDERFASILRLEPDGSTSVYAHGVRNTVGFDWHPETGALWFTDNGRDMMGDDIPAEEVNVATKPGMHFGYPHVHAGTVLDPEFGQGKQPDDYSPPEVLIQAHSAALGMKFYTGDRFPSEYGLALFIAEHGSWNRSRKVGYLVSVVTFDESGSHYKPFITGWLEGENNWGRPSDVLVTPDGNLLISDDQAGVIYRVRYTGT